ncbi:MAG: protein arginine kinase [Candidatus Omnitrophica bacterium]|nr:protein arginine kinase [Candidatus Omnitrophota bacterium]
MALEELLKTTCEWLKGKGPDSDIVVSSRIRLARNLNGYPFCSKLSKDEEKNIVDEVHDATQATEPTQDAYFLLNEDLTDLDKQFLLERHLISVEHTAKPSGATCLTKDETVSIMVLEEDHLRLQVLSSGFSVKNCWETINRIDTLLEEKLSFSFHNMLGYLTACPTNVGTGLRASCMLHLPSLVITKQINKALQALVKLNIAARGLYGEGTEASGNFFQFSNQVTLGQNEMEIIDGFDKVIRQIIDNEREARRTLTEKKQDRFYDQIWRSLGVLKSARLINSREATSLLSMVRLGVDSGIIEGLAREKLNELLIFCQPAHLQKLVRRNLSSSERDKERAQLIRKTLKSVDVQ